MLVFFICHDASHILIDAGATLLSINGRLPCCPHSGIEVVLDILRLIVSRLLKFRVDKVFDRFMRSVAKVPVVFCISQLDNTEVEIDPNEPF